MTIIKASDYKNRDDLEKYVRNNIGLTPDIKQDYSIQGTKKELSRLHLSEETLFWGIRCKKLDGKEKLSKEEVPNRGKIYKSGINLKKE